MKERLGRLSLRLKIILLQELCLLLAAMHFKLHLVLVL